LRVDLRKPRRALAVALTAAGLAACGSSATKSPSTASTASSPSSSTTATGAATTPATTTSPPPGYQPAGWTGETGPNVAYPLLKLTSAGFSSAQHASALVTIRVIGSKRQICWSFSKLVGVAHPTTAGLRGGSPGTPTGGTGSVEISLGTHYSPQGCTPPIAGAGLQSIVNNSAHTYVTVDSRKYPSGAIFAQL
jgi:hypothetical protein